MNKNSASKSNGAQTTAAQPGTDRDKRTLLARQRARKHYDPEFWERLAQGSGALS